MHLAVGGPGQAGGCSSKGPQKGVPQAVRQVREKVAKAAEGGYVG